MKVIDGGVYVTENGYIVEVKRNSLPHYKFSANRAKDFSTGEIVKLSEVWAEDGKAYHNDCGFNFVSQIEF